MTEDTELDRLFATARATRLLPSDDLMARVLADAYATQPAPSAMHSARPAPIRRGFWATIAAVLGGQGALAGMGTAAMAGLWLGYADPAPLDWLAGALMPWSGAEVDLMGADALFLSEG